MPLSFKKLRRSIRAPFTLFSFGKNKAKRNARNARVRDSFKPEPRAIREVPEVQIETQPQVESPKLLPALPSVIDGLRDVDTHINAPSTPNTLSSIADSSFPSTPATYSSVSAPAIRTNDNCVEPSLQDVLDTQWLAASIRIEEEVNPSPKVQSKEIPAPLATTKKELKLSMDQSAFLPLMPFDDLAIVSLIAKEDEQPTSSVSTPATQVAPAPTLSSTASVETITPTAVVIPKQESEVLQSGGELAATAVTPNFVDEAESPASASAPTTLAQTLCPATVQENAVHSAPPITPNEMGSEPVSPVMTPTRIEAPTDPAPIKGPVRKSSSVGLRRKSSRSQTLLPSPSSSSKTEVMLAPVLDAPAPLEETASASDEVPTPAPKRKSSTATSNGSVRTLPLSPKTETKPTTYVAVPELEPVKHPRRKSSLSSLKQVRPTPVSVGTPPLKTPIKKNSQAGLTTPRTPTSPTASIQAAMTAQKQKEAEIAAELQASLRSRETRRLQREAAEKVRKEEELRQIAEKHRQISEMGAWTKQDPQERETVLKEVRSWRKQREATFQSLPDETAKDAEYRAAFVREEIRHELAAAAEIRAQKAPCMDEIQEKRQVALEELYATRLPAMPIRA